MATKYAYIEAVDIGCGEINVSGKTAGGRLLFGFRAMNDGFQLWRDKARAYTPASYIPVFQVNRPARLLAA